DLNGVMGTDLASREVETVAGYLIEEIGRIPREGESFDIGGVRFLVLSAEKTRVRKIRLDLRPGEDIDGDD
ncbi:MAG TPA: hypothetical protein ENO23_02325, partial [Alphaproteobacteria bacterium]|nr:hypothetical protein [Alphaproteobacteria bacterium]